jgi:hypothetical protein
VIAPATVGAAPAGGTNISAAPRVAPHHPAHTVRLRYERSRTVTQSWRFRGGVAAAPQDE